MEALDQLLTGGINKLILWVLALSSLFVVLEVVGLLPRKVSEKINQNRLSETMRLLKQFGVDVETPRRVNNVSRLEQISGRDLESRVKKRIAASKIDHPVVVGREIRVPGDHYIDLMGATCNIDVARMYARDLAALWRRLADVGGPIANTGFDFVVAPKAGSPILAAAFAELLNKPLLLHNHEPKFASDVSDPKAVFDCYEIPTRGARGLIVDDSSTGGGKAVRLIADVRKFGWSVSDFIVIFEPQVKSHSNQNAAARLRNANVTLHSIVKT